MGKLKYMKIRERKIAIINTCNFGSTGKISYGLFQYFKDCGIDSCFCYGYGKSNNENKTYRITTKIERYVHAFLSRLTGFHGNYSVMATKRLFNYLEKNEINTIYAVSLHGYYINEKMLFDYISIKKIDFIYIMIDEYPFRGKCGNANQCKNYLNGCGKCPYLKEPDKSWFIDQTAKMFRMKKEAYDKIKGHSIFVGPEFTIKQGKESPLLKNIRTEIIDEAIDTDFYYPRDVENMKKEMGIEGKTVILCVAPSSYGRKGTKYFTELARRFENDEKYVFVHVGYTDSTEGLPRNYVPIGYVEDQELLAHYYSLGDLFVFPSLLDTMPNACLEALSCGVPLLCFNTSGMPYLGDERVLTLAEPKNVDALAEVVKHTEKRTSDVTNKCREYAKHRYSSKLYHEKLALLLEQL